MRKKKEKVFDYEKFLEENADVDKRITLLENMCVKHISKYKNVVYNPYKRDTIVLTDELQGLFFHLINTLKEKALKSKPSNYDYFAKYNPDKYSDNDKLRNMKASRTAGYMVYGGFVDLDRDVDYNHKDDYNEIILDILKNNMFHIKKNRYYKVYGSAKNVDVKYIHMDDYVKANLSSYAAEHKFTQYHLTKRKDILKAIFNPRYLQVKKLWRIEINRVERSYLNYMFHLKEFSVLNDLRPFMRLRYDQFFDKYEYHGFQIFFLFEDIFFSFFL